MKRRTFMKGVLGAAAALAGVKAAADPKKKIVVVSNPTAEHSGAMYEMFVKAKAMLDAALVPNDAVYFDNRYWWIADDKQGIEYSEPMDADIFADQPDYNYTNLFNAFDKEIRKAHIDASTYGTGVVRDNKHVPFRKYAGQSVIIENNGKGGPRSGKYRLT